MKSGILRSTLALSEPKKAHDADALATASSLSSSVLRATPLSFAFGAALEVLARWEVHGVEVRKAQIPTRDEKDETVATSVREYLLKFRRLVRNRVPKLAYALHIAEALASSAPPAPAPVSAAVVAEAIAAAASKAIPVPEPLPGV